MNPHVVIASSSERGESRASKDPDPGLEARPDHSPMRTMILKRFAARTDFHSRVDSNSPAVASSGSRGPLPPERAGFIQHSPSAGTVRTAFVGAKLWTSGNFEAWIQARLKPWGWNAMALSLNWRRSFDTATRHQGVTGTAKGPNISRSAIRQQVWLIEGRAGMKPFNRLLQGAPLTVSRRRPFLNVAGEPALPERSLADDRMSPTSTVKVICCSNGCP